MTSITMAKCVRATTNCGCFIQQLDSERVTPMSSFSSSSSVANYFNKLAIALNNIATQFMKIKQYEEAHEILSDAIAAMKFSLNPNGFPSQRLLQSVRESKMSSLSVEWNPILLHAKSKLDSLSPPPPLRRRRKRTDLKLQQEEEYKQGLILPFDIPAQIDDASESAVEMNSGNSSKESAIILYNIALNEHLGFGIGQVKDIGALRRALKFYILAQKTLYNAITNTITNTKTNNEEEESFTSTLFSMAIANNMGHIYYELGNDLEAQYCFDDILQIHADSSLFDNDENGTMTKMMDMFILNSMLLDMRPIASSAA